MLMKTVRKFTVMQFNWGYKKLLKKDASAGRVMPAFSVKAATLIAGLVLAQTASAALVTNASDPRSWQGATVGTFAQLYYGADNATNRGLVVSNQLLDDSYFNASGYTGASLIRYNGSNPATTSYSYGISQDQPNVVDGFDGSFSYTWGPNSANGAAIGANSIDQNWIQTDNVIGNTVFDMGFGASKAAIFNTIDHGPLPWEAIESSVYLSNDMVSWTQAVTERVWLEGFNSDTSVVWDGFAYAVGTGTSATFRYASIVWGGPGALLADGDNEINGVMGLRGDYTPVAAVPEPETYAMLLAGLGLLGFTARRRKNLAA